MPRAIKAEQNKDCDRLCAHICSLFLNVHCDLSSPDCARLAHLLLVTRFLVKRGQTKKKRKEGDGVYYMQHLDTWMEASAFILFH